MYQKRELTNDQEKIYIYPQRKPLNKPSAIEDSFVSHDLIQVRRLLLIMPTQNTLFRLDDMPYHAPIL